MAYDSSRNYAQEIQDLIAAGGDPAVVNQLLNERLEKQQGTNSQYSTYDDVYRSAMDYMAGKGYTPKAGANVNYAEIANQILLDQGDRGVGMDLAADRSWADLGTVLDARQNKLNTGAYDEWQHSTIGDSNVKYNGDGSMYSTLQQGQEMSYGELRDKYGQGQGKVIMTPTGYVGSGAAIGWGNDPAYEAGQTMTMGEDRAARILTGREASPTVGSAHASGAAGGANLGYSKEAWEKKQNREAARNLAGETNAATRVPVQGENSSYVKVNTNNAFEAAVQALMQGEDKEGAQAMQNAWNQYGINGLVDILMPQVSRDGYQSNVPVYGVYGAGTGEAGTGAGAQYPVETGGIRVGVVDQSYLYPELTDAQRAVLRDTAQANGDKLFTFAGTKFDNNSLTAQSGDISAKDKAAQIIRQPDAEITPVKPTLPVTQGAATGQDTTMYYGLPEGEAYVQTAQLTDNAYRQAYQQAAASGDAAAMSAVMAEWNAWKQAISQNLTREQVTSLGW